MCCNCWKCVSLQQAQQTVGKINSVRLWLMILWLTAASCLNKGRFSTKVLADLWGGLYYLVLSLLFSLISVQISLESWIWMLKTKTGGQIQRTGGFQWGRGSFWRGLRVFLVCLSPWSSLTPHHNLLQEQRCASVTPSLMRLAQVNDFQPLKTAASWLWVTPAASLVPLFLYSLSLHPAWLVKAKLHEPLWGGTE